MHEPLYVIVDRRGQRWKPVTWEACLRLVKVYRRHVRCVEAYVDSRPRSEVPIGRPVSPVDRLCWRLCVVLALCCSIYAVAVSAASASTVDDEVALSRSYLPVDHPCRVGPIAVHWVYGLRTAQGMESAGAAVVGHRSLTGAWVEPDGGPLRCDVWLDSRQWEIMTPCERRRLAIHEVMHLGGHDHAEGGIMLASPYEREEVAVPGCPAAVASILDRVSGRVLGLVPPGWAVSCGPRRGRVVRCTADDGARRTRRYRARAWDAAWSGFTVVRIKR